MENLFLYLVKVSALIALFSLSYNFFLKKDTFFSSIRFFLISGIATSFILPLFTITKIIWVDPSPILQQITTKSLPVIPAPAPALEESFEMNLWYVAGIIYLIGALFFLFRFIADIYRVSTILKNQNLKKVDGFKFIDTDKNISPFSFFRYIVFTSSALSTEELNNIIAHEKVHSSQLHSLDMIISQLACIVLWFNPFIWLYKKQIAQNLEFIADAGAIKAVADSEAYQKTLLKITLQPQCIAITNHFYQSLIKKRIIMLNKKQSKKLNFIKFAIIVPVVGAFIYFFQTEVVAQERTITQKKEISTAQKEIQPKEAVAYGSELTYPADATVRIDKDITDAVMNERKKMFKDIFDADVFFKNVRRNSKGEITAIKVMVKDKDHKLNYPVYEVTSDDNTAILPFTLSIEKKNKNGKNIISYNKIEVSVAKAETTTSPLSEEKFKHEIHSPTEYINSRRKNRDVVVIVNGEIQNSKYIDTPPGEKFETIMEIDAASALKKYNVKAKDGAIVLTTAKIENPISSSVNKTAPDPYSFTSNAGNVTNRSINTSITENVGQMNSGSSRFVTVQTLRYNDGTIIANDGENIYFMINSTTTNIQLNSYKEDLEKAGIKTEYSDIKRNNTGKIISIKIKLADKNANSKATGSWDIKKKDSTIPDIYIGKIKDKLTVSAASE
ncbi:M56 family metallopeptidase [Flavobacterium sp. DG1-102-2]|uniref:M56 family metallopeptidase n=1 Tax=Flavobacterium sp. DG1-102-2 TaxID=3081663 RepID=UPI002949E3AC|nr:M56 family metallopeptidase [Flavobacterium sp. DG1-102-2]MDV6169760.1 M56 family metallopeptidase [Flavobacterium sp. DG1-102-2]